MSLTAAPSADATAPPRPHGGHPAQLLRLVLAFVLAVAGSVTVMVATAGPASAASARLTDFDNRMLILVNKARVAAGVGELTAATGLVNLSVMWSSKMADGATSNKLEHNPNAFEQTLSYGASNRTAWAENVAKWSPTSTSADEIFNAYMASPGHKANILGSRYAYVGIGSVTGSNGASWNTMTFTDKVEAGQAIVPRPAAGSVDSVTVAAGQIKVTGWAYDPNSASASNPVHVYVNDVGTQVSTTVSRPDVNAAFGVSGTHGFSASFPAKVGVNKVCVFSISITGYDNTLLNCQNIQWAPAPPPSGSFDSLTIVDGQLAVSGWTFEPATSGAANTVSITVNGAAPATVKTTVARSDVNSAFGITGTHGYTAAYPARGGANTVCITANSVVNAGISTSLGCNTVTFAAPSGSFDAVTRDANGITVAGWAIDPGAPGSSMPVHVYVNNVGTSISTDKNRTDVNSAFGVTGNHGYSARVPAPTGALQVCVFAISVTGADNLLIGCKTLAAPPAATGAFDGVSRTAGGVSVRGWAYDPASSASSNPVHVYVNNVGTQVGTTVGRGDVNAAFGISGTHGYDAVVPAPSTGALSVCVFSISISGGNNTLVGCRNL